MTVLLLIRHALCDPVGRSIAGRKPGIHLNPAGRSQAAALANRLAVLPISAIYSSPMERARETAEPVARRLGLKVQTEPGLDEIDFGEWTGRTLAELDVIPAWRAFNEERSTTRIPGGELIGEVLERALEACGRISRTHRNPGAVVALVSHGDVLRALIAHFAGISLDLMRRIELSPASLSVVSLGPYPRLLLLNSTEAWPEEVLPNAGGEARA